MSRQERKCVEDARSQLPALLADTTGRARQLSLLGLAGSGRGLWGRDSVKTLRKLRHEWDR